MTKRLFDLVVGVLLLLIASPLLVFTAVVIRIVDGAPVLFRQERVGQGGGTFTIYKFRTMRSGSNPADRALTIGRDHRITPLGHWLRASKLDELPQLLNVLKGEMSLVGPRPEVPQYVALYTPEQVPVLQLKPGITDPASIVYRDEAQVLAGAKDPLRYYVEVVMPDKIRINLEYAKRASVGRDVMVLARTLLAVLRPSSK